MKVKWNRAAAILTAGMLLLSGCVSSGGPSQTDSGVQGGESSQSQTASSGPEETVPEPSDAAAFFNDAVFVGDSVSLRLSFYCQAHPGVLGTAQFLTSGSLGSGNALWDVGANSVHPSYQGEKMLVEDGVKAMGAKKVFLMLGMNDVGLYGVEDSVTNLNTLLQRILEKSPDAEIYIQAATPILAGRERKTLNNENLDKYNAALKELAREKGYHFADVASVMKVEDGSLNPDYCSDPEDMGIHFTDAGAKVWIDYLLENAQDF